MLFARTPGERQSRLAPASRVCQTPPHETATLSPALLRESTHSE